ncbi:hypothetical protein [uncultured Rhodospira sp.]|uniref:hypothetical protein n=1 Tax=uncultured Rhodospira sp. TaxID=1936189 RepID=UPI00261D26F6|nr:hypothetical protein [uncultured Rhodospira sp.]
MILIRLFGWCLVGVASVAASAEAVLALSPGQGSPPGLATGELWTLLSGVPASAFASPDHWLEVIAATVMVLPAWVAFALTGLLLLMVGRLGRRRHRHSAFN